jgi:hypothetical protein
MLQVPVKLNLPETFFFLNPQWRPTYLLNKETNIRAVGVT